MREETLKHIGDKCHAIQEQAFDGLDHNTEMLGRTNQALGRIEHIVERHINSSH